MGRDFQVKETPGPEVRQPGDVWGAGWGGERMHREARWQRVLRTPGFTPSTAPTLKEAENHLFTLKCILKTVHYGWTDRQESYAYKRA